MKNKPFSFGGGDFDVKEALVEWGKALVSNLPIPQEKKGARRQPRRVGGRLL